MHYETYRDAKGEYRWRLRATNGQIIASGEGYTRREDRDAAIGLVKISSTAPVREASSGDDPVPAGVWGGELP